MKAHSFTSFRSSFFVALLAVASLNLAVAAPGPTPHDGRDSRDYRGNRDSSPSKQQGPVSKSTPKTPVVVVKPAPVVVKPAPAVVVKPAPAVVVKPAPTVVVTRSAEQVIVDDYIKLLGMLPIISSDVQSGRATMAQAVAQLMDTAQALRAINMKIGAADPLGIRIRALLAQPACDQSVRARLDAGAACNQDLANKQYLGNPTFQAAVAELISAMYNAG